MHATTVAYVVHHVEMTTTRSSRNRNPRFTISLDLPPLSFNENRIITHFSSLKPPRLSSPKQIKTCRHLNLQIFTPGFSLKINPINFCFFPQQAFPSYKTRRSCKGKKSNKSRFKNEF